MNGAARLPGKNDIAIGMAYSGEARGVNAALSIAKEKGAEIIAITSTPDSPLARMAGSSQTSRNGSMLPEKRFCKTG